MSTNPIESSPTNPNPPSSSGSPSSADTKAKTSLRSRAENVLRSPSTGILISIGSLILISWLFIKIDHDARQDSVDLLKALSWPAVVIAAIFVFRKALPLFLQELGKRATKLSLWQVSVELSTVPEAKALPMPSLEEIKSEELGSAPVGDSKKELFRAIVESSPAEYTEINLGAGQEWLTSRVYLLSVLLERMRGVRCFVFLDSAGQDRHFIGFAAPNKVRWALVKKYPWLEVAFVKAAAALYYTDALNWQDGQKVVLNNLGTLPLSDADNIGSFFLNGIKSPGPVPNTAGWTDLSGGTPNNLRWERAEWLSTNLLFDLLGDDLQENIVEDDSEMTNQERAERILRSKGDYVALVEKQGHRFKRLANRKSLLEQVVTQLDRPQK